MDLGSPRGIWESLGDIEGFQGGGSGKERQVSQPKVRSGKFFVNSHQAEQRPQTRVKGSASRGRVTQRCRQSSMHTIRV